MLRVEDPPYVYTMNKNLFDLGYKIEKNIKIKIQWDRFQIA